MTLPQLITILLAAIAGTLALTTMGSNIQVSFRNPFFLYCQITCNVFDKVLGLRGCSRGSQ
jgi:hypothetical protein